MVPGLNEIVVLAIILSLIFAIDIYGLLKKVFKKHR
jgi:hypothetical protein